ncbi:hypothetical protein E4U43_008368 [Claviceps pusilla]|uniref:RWD domain-containing protein n=1 Tax=Claviceps pusilla TaxID=123648 RepID=A0A9P7NB87_9HYPO|nr:hypothetical protein E4U43_008368 [Claviceps pusilla]
MSADLVDEIEAISSIYGPGTLTPSPDAGGPPWRYILRLPADDAGPSSSSTALLLGFPAEYPLTAPVVMGTHHARGGVRGAGAGDLVLFRRVLGEVFREGCVCLFDGVEEFQRRRRVCEAAADGEGEMAEEVAPKEMAPKEMPDEAEEEAEEEEEEEEYEPAQWTLSEVVIENKSTFVARVARVASPEEARRHVADLLAREKKVRGATHNITAWRIRTGEGLQFQDCDDDGEAAAGGRLLHLLQVMDVWGVVVVVSRWFGGVKLGPRRFAVINAVARDGLVRGGFVEGGKEKKRR